MFSINITAPSTIIPKSTAPILKRLAGISKSLNSKNAKPNASGITSEAMRVILKSKINANKTIMTKIIPTTML